MIYLHNKRKFHFQPNSLLLLHFDGADTSTTITDDGTIGGAPHTMTANGNAQLDTAIKKIGSAALLLDGTGDSVSSAASADWNLTGDFTIEMWIYAVALNTDIIRSSSSDDFSTFTDNDWGFLVDGSGNLTFYVKNGTGAGGPSTVSTSTWTHVVAERFGPNLRVYKDGTPGSASSNTNALGNTSALKIGDAVAGLDSGFNGSIDELRYTPYAVYRGGSFTPPTIAFTK
jgi:hypothetical protein